MKVILLKDVRHLGQAHDIKDVANGYAMNFLFPNGLASAATAEKMQEMEAQKAAHDAQLEKADQELAATLDELRGKTVTIAARATEKGGLFKQISAREIVGAVASQLQIGLTEDSIELPEHIKTTGEHAVLVKSKSSHAAFTVSVVAAQ